MSRDRKPRKNTGRSPARSGGSTLVGIFIGLVLGALIAAGAAWYFTRAMPFQVPVPGPRLPAAETEPAPLPGRPGGRPVVKQDFQFYKMLPQGNGTATEAPAAAAAAPQATAQPAAVQPAPPPKPAESLYLQVGAFEDAAQADDLKAQLALRGFEANTQSGQSSAGRTVHRVRVGPFARPDELAAVRSRLADAGFATAVVKAAP